MRKARRYDFIQEAPGLQGKLWKVSLDHTMVTGRSEDTGGVTGTLIKEGAVVMTTGRVLFTHANEFVARLYEMDAQEYEVLSGGEVGFVIRRYLEKIS